MLQLSRSTAIPVLSSSPQYLHYRLLQEYLHAMSPHILLTSLCEVLQHVWTQNVGWHREYLSILPSFRCAERLDLTNI